MRPPDDTLELFIVEDTAQWCKEVEACYIGGWVDATFVPAAGARSVWHEIVHHVVAGSSVGMTDRFLSEGLASALGDDWCPPSSDLVWPQAPLRDLLGRPEVRYENYPRAAQFVDFVRNRYGAETLLELIHCVDREDPLPLVERCFQRTFGKGIGEVDIEFSRHPPRNHESLALCGGPVEHWDAHRTWHHAVSLSCDSPATVNTFEHVHGREVTTLLEVPRAGWYEVEVSADGDATVAVEPCFCPQRPGALLGSTRSGMLWVGETGTHRVSIRTDDPGATRARVTLTPTERDPSPPV